MVQKLSGLYTQACGKLFHDLKEHKEIQSELMARASMFPSVIVTPSVSKTAERQQIKDALNGLCSWATSNIHVAPVAYCCTSVESA